MRVIAGIILIVFLSVAFANIVYCFQGGIHHHMDPIAHIDMWKANFETLIISPLALTFLIIICSLFFIFSWGTKGLKLFLKNSQSQLHAPPWVDQRHNPLLKTYNKLSLVYAQGIIEPLVYN